MRLHIKLLLCACLVSGSLAGPLVANDNANETVTYWDSSMELCPLETSQIEKTVPSLAEFLKTKQYERVSGLPHEQTLAFEKGFTFGIVLSEQVGSVAKLIDALNKGKTLEGADSSAAYAMLELAECLEVTPNDLDLIETMTAGFVETGLLENTDLSSNHYFQALEKAKCMRWLEATRRLLAIEPETPDLATLVKSIQVDTIGQCEKAS